MAGFLKEPPTSEPIPIIDPPEPMSKVMRIGSVTFCDPFIQNILQNTPILSDNRHRHHWIHVPYFREQFPQKLFFFEFGLIYIDVRKLFKGGNYLRAETIPGNTLFGRQQIFKELLNERVTECVASDLHDFTNE